MVDNNETAKSKFLAIDPTPVRRNSHYVDPAIQKYIDDVVEQRIAEQFESFKVEMMRKLNWTIYTYEKQEDLERGKVWVSYFTGFVESIISGIESSFNRKDANLEDAENVSETYRNNKDKY